MGVDSATIIAIAAATYGLVVSSLIGGAISRRLIEKNALLPSGSETIALDNNGLSKACPMTSLVTVLVTMALGTYLVQVLNITGVAFPYFVGGVFAAAIIRNLADLRGYELAMPHINLMGSCSLNIFLTLSLMSLKIWELFILALPMILILLSQTLLVLIFAYFAIFKFMGKNYEAAVMSAGCCGAGLGQIPSAIANMSVVIDEYGPAPNAWLVLPVIMVIVVNLVNPLVVTLFMNFLA